MKTIACYNIPRFYSAYGIVLGRQYQNAKLIQREQYWCRECKTSFTIDRKYHNYYGYYGGFNSNLAFCPACGAKHTTDWNGPKHTHWFNDDIKNESEAIPLSARLTLMEGKYVMILRVRYKVMQYVIGESKEHYDIKLSERQEEIRFNVKKRVSTFASRTGKDKACCEIGDPFLDPLRNSLLVNISSANYSEQQRADTVSLLKTLRDKIRKKWRQLHGYDIGGLFVGYGRDFGRMTCQLSNLAYRLVYADAPNLPKVFGEQLPKRQGYFAREWVLSKEHLDLYGKLDTIRKAGNSVEGVIKLFNLPDIPRIRQKLTENLFFAGELRRVFDITENPDSAMMLWEVMHGKYNSYSWLSDIYDFLTLLSRHYGTDSILAYIRHTSYQDIHDTEKMYRRLSKERQEALWGERCRLKDLHDALVKATKHQQIEGFPLEVPEHIKKRLSMQLDQLKFYLPEHSKELQEIGDKMHNCVGTYDNRMLAQICNIVPVTDDNGKLVACIEVRDGRVVQAKLRHNKHVHENNEINDAVLHWAELAKLKVETPDLHTHAEETEEIRKAV